MDEDELHYYHMLLSESISSDEAFYMIFYYHRLLLLTGILLNGSGRKYMFSVWMIDNIVFLEPVFYSKFFWNTLWAFHI